MTTPKCPSTAAPRSKVLVVDDHPLTRYGTARLLEQEPDLIVCGEAENASRALAAIEALKPQLVLADLSMPGGDGLEFIKDVRSLHPEVAVLVFSMHDETFYAQRALRAGAQGYVMKSAGGEKLVAALRQVLRGEIYVSEKLAGQIAENFSGRRRREDESPVGNLTDREFEVFALLGQGLSTREIGARLHLSAKTVETHRGHVRAKLRLTTGPALIQYATRWTATQASI